LFRKENPNIPMSDSFAKRLLNPIYLKSLNDSIKEDTNNEFISLIPISDDELDAVEIKSFYPELIKIIKKEYPKRWRFVYNVLIDKMHYDCLNEDKYNMSGMSLRNYYHSCIKTIKKYPELISLLRNNEKPIDLDLYESNNLKLAV